MLNILSIFQNSSPFHPSFRLISQIIRLEGWFLSRRESKHQPLLWICIIYQQGSSFSEPATSLPFYFSMMMFGHHSTAVSSSCIFQMLHESQVALFLWTTLFLPPWASQIRGRITSVCSFGLHATSASHVRSFSAIRLNENHWNATIQKCLSEPTIPFATPIPTPTFSHAKNEAVKLPFICSLCRSSWTCIMKSEAGHKTPVFLDVSLSLEALRWCLQVFCVATSSLAVR